MTERRPHWDDELIFAVMSAAGDGGHLFIDDIYAVIAAVEDWQDANGSSRAGAPMHRLIEAEAAIKKARAVPPKDPYRPGSLGVHYRLGYNDALRDVLRALDGER